jgi:predicted HD phosphohydrolase
VSQKPFIYAGRWNYARNKVCAKRKAFGKFECYFQNFSPGCGRNTARVQGGAVQAEQAEFS